MKTIILLIHLVVAVGLISLILLQSSQGGLGSAFGGGEAYRTKRGAERVVFIGTIILAVLFLITSVTTFLL
ncbi:preprotein translocase subunit SecG, partial [Candidatus Gottesmanbacteria bacterium]|nr:preprotein translocase subunit SecG [Candidatus Gottesmanbacteria bacterium]